MKIKSIIFNVLLIIILICLIYFFIYLNNSNFENFADIICNPDNKNPSEECKNLQYVEGTNVPSQAISIGTPMEAIKDIIVNDGSKFEKPLKNANFGYILEAATPEGEIKKTYVDGYYWINIQDVGTNYIYCIMDKKYFGGGWMLAMRSVHNSQEFSYDSQHFKQSTLLNNKTEDIKKAITDLKESDFTISSIGNRIYDTNNINAKIYDAKFDPFNNTKSSEWMAIFYAKDRNGNIIKGGDYPDNNRGWVWYEKNIKIDATNDYDNTKIKKLVSPLELFQYLDRQKKDKDRKMMPKDKNGKFIHAQDMGGKFTNATSREPLPMTNILFSSRKKGSNNHSIYGLNYPYYTNKIRWGFFFKDRTISSSQNLLECIGGIGCTNHSAGNFEIPSGNNEEFLDRPAEEFRNRSYAVEWYVRENASNCSD